MRTWRRWIPARSEGEWLERLAFLGRTRVAVSGQPEKSAARLEAYGITSKEARLLVDRFGGQVIALKAVDWARAGSRRAQPLRIRDALVVVGSECEKMRVGRQAPRRKILLIPAGMAFGTGDHATTAGCLRFLCDVSKDLGPRSWSMLDLGTGSGILSIAAKLLGAHRAEAYDFDANAVRIARQNARANKARGIKFRRVDVTRWQPAQKYDVLAANLYSEMLIAVSAKIAEAVRPGGRLVISGILRGQEKKCLAAFRRRGFRIDRVVRHGKWSAALATGRGDS